MIRELRTLVAVARDGTFTAAGRRLGLTQAAVSAQMQRLESEFGLDLFDRVGRTVRLNAVGHRTLVQAQELIRLYGLLGSNPTEDSAVALVSIGAIASVQRSLLPDALATFRAQVPHGRIRVVPGLSMELIDRVDAGDLDLATIIRPPYALHTDLRWTTLAQEPFRLLVPREVRGDDWHALLSTQPFVRYDRASFGGRQVERFLRAEQLEVHKVCEVDELDAIVRLVGCEVGVALLPQTAMHRRWPASVRAIDLGPRTFHRDIGLVHRPTRLLSEAVRALARLIRERYAQDSATATVPRRR